VLAALKATNVVDERLRRERDFMAFLETRPALKAEYGDVIAAQTAVYSNDVEANADLNLALDWLQKSSTVGYASALYEFALARAQTSDRDREPQFQERNWPDVKQSLLDDEPIVPGLEEDLLARGIERALALKPPQQISAVQRLAARVNAGRALPASARDLARVVLTGSQVGSVAGRKPLVGASAAALEASTDSAVSFARDLEPSLRDLRSRVRVLNEKILRNRSRFARGIQAWKGSSIYPDANFTLRTSYGKVDGFTDQKGPRVPFATRFGDMFALAASRGNAGEFALPPKLIAWRKSIGDEVFKSKYADMVVNFISTNDITGGNSGSSTLNRRLDIVGLIFDGNEGSMASDWSYNGATGRALSTDIRFALTIAREVHDAGWIVEELLNPDRALKTIPAAAD
jgi:Peptidase S46